ncbi:MAG: ABC transporter permease subunit [Oscillospiraceae bacterium]|nr:ABC transporter permease subunit [Oscillospiraceae bacterium]
MNNLVLKRRTWQFSEGLKILLCVFWLLFIIFPLGKMLSTMTTVNVSAILSARKFKKALLQSLSASSCATLISVGLAGILSWCVARTNVRHKTVINTLLCVPMLIPSISHGMGLIIILGVNGWIARLLGMQGGIYGFPGIVMGSVLYSFPVAYLMLYDVLQYEDGTPYEAAATMGMSSKDKLFAITLPYLKKPLISVFFAIFTMIVTDYGVPLMIGGKYITLPVMMYQDVIGMLDFGKGSVIGMILLTPAIVACVLDIAGREKGRSGYVGKPFSIKENPLRDKFAYIVIFLVILCIFLPIGSFTVLGFVKKYPIDNSFSLENIWQAVQMGAWRYLKNSLIIAVLVSVLGSILAVMNAYLVARKKTRISYVLHLMSITSLAIPGIVLGLSYIMFFKGTLLYGTFTILVFVNSIHFFASPYLMIYNTFGKINENLEDVGSTMGIRRSRIIFDIILPQSMGTILEMVSYFFVNCMMTISAVSFLANVSNKPVSLMIPQFEGQMQLECAAFISLLILVVNVIMKLGIYRIKRTCR